MEWHDSGHYFRQESGTPHTRNTRTCLQPRVVILRSYFLVAMTSFVSRFNSDIVKDNMVGRSLNRRSLHFSTPAGMIIQSYLTIELLFIFVYLPITHSPFTAINDNFIVVNNMCCKYYISSICQCFMLFLNYDFINLFRSN